MTAREVLLFALARCERSRAAGTDCPPLSAVIQSASGNSPATAHIAREARRIVAVELRLPKLPDVLWTWSEGKTWDDYIAALRKALESAP
jgi:hypothetical protein